MHHKENLAHHNEEEPPLAATRESPHAATDPTQPKINKQTNKTPKKSKKKKKRILDGFFLNMIKKKIYIYIYIYIYVYIYMYTLFLKTSHFLNWETLQVFSLSPETGKDAHYLHYWSTLYQGYLEID